MTKLSDLFTEHGQSPWIDNLKRSYVRQGGLEDLIAAGIRGVTSNPTIMAKAIEAGNDYDEQFGELVRADVPIADTVLGARPRGCDRRALDILRPLYDSSNGGDGFVSVEVAPSLAHDTQGTIVAERSLHNRIDRRNVFVKIPATKEGLPAIEAAIGSGHKINVTLIFSLDRYQEVIEAYLSGLETLAAAGGDLGDVASVASFFVSRVDTEIDRRLEAIAEESPDSPRAKTALDLRGTAALAQARVAYAIFKERFSSSRWTALKEKGARVQRPLWASTSTKNPAYPDLLYVDGLIGPDTVNTMPDQTVEAFLDHGTLAAPSTRKRTRRRATLSDLQEVGIDLDDVTAQLESEGVAAFAKSFDELQERLTQKAVTLRSSN